MRAVTWNVLGCHHKSFDERWPIISNRLALENPDIFALQEFPEPHVPHLNSIFGETHTIVHTPPAERLTTVTLGIRTDMVKDIKAIETAGKVRNEAVLAEVKMSAGPMAVAAVHHDYRAIRHRRTAQVGAIKEVCDPYDHALVMGDHNAFPIMRPIRKMRQAGFESAHRLAHGTDPEFTYPNPIGEEILPAHERRVVSAMRRVLPLIGTNYVLDYIWCKGIEPTAAGVVGVHREDRKDPSDHVGLFAEFED